MEGRSHAGYLEQLQEARHRDVEHASTPQLPGNSSSLDAVACPLQVALDGLVGRVFQQAEAVGLAVVAVRQLLENEPTGWKGKLPADNRCRSSRSL